MSTTELFDQSATPKRAERITIRRPDDFHVHLRDGAMLQAVLPFTAAQFARGLIMPNLLPPVTTAAAAAAYRSRILAASPAGGDFTPLMTCYLTETTDPEDVARGYLAGDFAAVKLYPAHATTNAGFGVAVLERVARVLERMAAIGMPLLIHGEIVDQEVDLYDREAFFIDRVLDPWRRRLPELRIVFEHITTEEAAHYVAAADANLAATITAHHLLINRNSIFAGGVRPHLYCLPIAKREKHRQALRRAAVSGDRRFFLGTDSAPHPVSAKETACGCAGIFTASSMPKSSRMKTRATGSKPSPHSAARPSTACRRTRGGSPPGREPIVSPHSRRRRPGFARRRQRDVPRCRAESEGRSA